MKDKVQIAREVEQTLRSLDHIEAADAHEFLYARIRHRMESRQQAPAGYHRLMLKLSLALGLFLCINGISYVVLNQRTHTTPAKSVSGSNAFAEAYQLNNNSYSY